MCLNQTTGLSWMYVWHRPSQALVKVPLHHRACPWSLSRRTSWVFSFWTTFQDYAHIFKPRQCLHSCIRCSYCALPFQVCAGRVRVRLRSNSPGGSGGAQQRDLTRSGREHVVLLYEHLLVVEPNLISSQPTSLSYRVTFSLKMISFK